MDNPTADSLKSLTELIAAHGVYALTVIALFYVERRASQNLQSAAARDRAHFRKLHVWAVVATYVLIAASSVVWVYGTFFYAADPHVQGSVVNLTNRPVLPSNATDQPSIQEQITTVANDVDLYANRRLREQTTDPGYDLEWVLMARGKDKLNAITLNFQRRYVLWRRRDPLPGISLNEDSLERGIVAREFTLDLAALHHPTSVQLTYDPDPDPDPAAAARKPGRLYVMQQGHKTPVPWNDNRGSLRVPPSSTLARLMPTPLATLLAQAQTASRLPSQSPCPFDAAGGYGDKVGRGLRERLGSPDLKMQLTTVDVLVACGARSLKFARDSLSVSGETGYDRALLVHNLSSATDQLAHNGQVISADLSLAFATAFASFQDYASASHYFDKAGAQPLANDNLYVTRGYTYVQTHQCEKAISDFERYLANGKNASYKALAHTNIGFCLAGQDESAKAIQHYQAAITADPRYALAYNDLAYLYAEQGRNLPEALSLVNHALSLEEDPSNILWFKDTKGWVLFKMGRYKEALSLLKEAVAGAPANANIRQHLDAVQKAIKG